MTGGRLGAALRRARSLLASPSADRDRPLLARFVHHGDQAAFTTLVERHGPMVLGVARRVLRDDHRAEDVFQATFLVLARRAAGLNLRGCLASWLYAVAYHAALRARADAARRRRLENAVAPRTTESIVEEAPAADVAPLLDAELQRLPAKYRQPLVLCYLQGRTNEEAALELGWPSGTVKCRLARGRDLLRARLTRRGAALSVGAASALAAPTVEAVPVASALVHQTVFQAVGAASGPVATLARGVMRTMFLAKLKVLGLAAAAVVVLTALLGVPFPPSSDPTAQATPLPTEARFLTEPIRRLPLETRFPRVWSVVVEEGEEERRPEKTPIAVVAQVLHGEEEAALKEFAAGKLVPVPPRAGARNVVFLLSPRYLFAFPDVNGSSLFSYPVDPPQACRASSFTLQGNRFTLTLDSWTSPPDQRPRAAFDKGEAGPQADPGRWAALIPIDVEQKDLPAGDYHLRVVFQEHRVRYQKYVGRREVDRVGALPFTLASVAAGPGGAAPTLREHSLHETAAPSAESQRPVVWPSSEQFLVQTKDRPPTVAVGELDRTWERLHEKMRKEKASWDEVSPSLTPVSPVAIPLVVVTGPPCNLWEFLTLQEVERQGNDFIVRVVLWQNPGPMKDGHGWLGNPVLLVPCFPQPLTTKGEYRVKVEWSLRRGSSEEGPYVEEDESKPEVAALKKRLAEKSTVSFTIK